MVDVKVHLLAADRKHQAFYDGIKAAEQLLGQDVEILWINEQPHQTRFWNKGIRGLLWQVMRQPEPVQRVYVEEYLGLGDLLFVYLFCRICRRVRIYLMLHNINKWFTLQYGSTLRRVLTFAASSLLTSRISEFIVASDSLKRYGEHLSKSAKPFRVVPFIPDVSNRQINVDHSMKLIVIPGNVEERRRDYITVFDACSRLAAEGKGFQLVLLCRLQIDRMSDQLRRALQAFASAHPAHLVTFSDFVDEDEFKAYIAAAACLIANIRPFFRGEYLTTEVYGLSKETGIRAWADAYDKVCMTPHELQPGSVPQNYRRYGNAEELHRLLCDVL